MNPIYIFLFSLFNLNTALLLPPVTDFSSRITKKPFGIYITPKTSPIQPEKFTGYHTGVDVEYQDISTAVPITAVYPGKIIFSGWVKGYGGVIAEKIYYQDNNYIVIYGHLSPASLVSKNIVVTAGQKIGELGVGYTKDTDGERRHLHLAILKGGEINLRGYVPVKSELVKWINPLVLPFLLLSKALSLP